MTPESSHYNRTVGDQQLLEVAPESSLSPTKAFGYNQDSPVDPFFEFRGCTTEGSVSPSPSGISSTWNSSSSEESSPMMPSPLLGFDATINIAEQAPGFTVSQLRTDENLASQAFCPAVQYNNNPAQNFASGYSGPMHGPSQLEFSVPMAEPFPTRMSSNFGVYGTGITIKEDKKENVWADQHIQVFSFGNGRPVAVPGSGPTPPAFPAQRTLNLNLGGCNSDPHAMRDHWIQVARSNNSVEESDVRKVFSKHPKTKVATVNTLKASALRRKHPAKFKCPFDGCEADFTRKHNLENHLRSHCGVTDLICPRCEKGFTTIPVWKRHQKTCPRTASRVDAGHPKSVLDMLMTEEHESKVFMS